MITGFDKNLVLRERSIEWSQFYINGRGQFSIVISNALKLNNLRKRAEYLFYFKEQIDNINFSQNSKIFFLHKKYGFYD